MMRRRVPNGFLPRIVSGEFLVRDGLEVEFRDGLAGHDLGKSIRDSEHMFGRWQVALVDVRLVAEPIDLDPRFLEIAQVIPGSIGLRAGPEELVFIHP
jgi:hypothetical protein